MGTDWELYRTGHVDTYEIGIIDLLAKHRKQPKWLVIELKVRKTSDQVLGQLLRYMGWVKERLAAKNESVEGLVIASRPDLQTLYGLTCLPDVRLMEYRRLDNALDLYETNLSLHRVSEAISRMDDDQRHAFFDSLHEN